jgi:hypothetical protein
VYQLPALWIRNYLTGSHFPQNHGFLRHTGTYQRKSKINVFLM